MTGSRIPPCTTLKVTVRRLIFRRDASKEKRQASATAALVVLLGQVGQASVACRNRGPLAPHFLLNLMSDVSVFLVHACGPGRDPVVLWLPLAGG